MKKLHLLFLILVMLCAFGCATNNSNQKEVIVYALEYSEPNRVRFSGRGAGAGMMLSGSMGPMGIAIGFAIDEGIAKDIAETAASAGLHFDDLFKTSIEADSNDSVQWLDTSDNQEVVLLYRIERYGFVSVKGSNDEVYPNIVMSKTDANGNISKWSIPDDLLGTERESLLPRAGFAEIKVDPEKIERLWREGIGLLNLE